MEWAEEPRPNLISSRWSSGTLCEILDIMVTVSVSLGSGSLPDPSGYGRFWLGLSVGTGGAIGALLALVKPLAGLKG